MNDKKTDTGSFQEKEIWFAQTHLDKQLAKEERDHEKLIRFAAAWKKAAERSGNKELMRLSKMAKMAGNIAYYDDKLPPVANDSELEALFREVAVSNSALRGSKHFQYTARQFRNKGYVDGMLTQVTKGCGGPMFVELCELGLGKSSAEMMVWTHVRDRLDEKTAAKLEDLLLEKGLIQKG